MTRPTPAMFQLNSPFLNIEDVSIKAFPTKGDPEFWIQILSKQQAWGHQLIRTDTQGHFPLPRHWVTIPLVLAVSLGIPKRPGKSAGCNRWLGWSWPTWTKFFGSFHVVSLEVKVFRRHIIVFMQNATNRNSTEPHVFFFYWKQVMPQIVWNAASHLADEWRHFDIHFRNSHTTHLSRSYPIPLDNKVRSGRLWNIPKYPEMKKRWKGVGRRVKSSKEGPPDLVLVHIGHLKLRLWTTNSSLFPKLFPRIQTPQVVCWSILNPWGLE